MSEATGRIAVLNTRGPLESIGRDYHWEGGEIARIDGWTIRELLGTNRPLAPGEVFTLGPWRVRVVEAEEWSQSYVVMRDGWRARVAEARYRLAGPLRFFSQRLILTLVVWGWAKYHPHTVPSWRDVRPPWKRKGGGQ